jgi:glycosyltransferase involved in cell wall biosynthesis
MGRLFELARELKELPARLRYRRALEQRLLAPPTCEPALSYGDVLPRGPGAIIHGGKVKLLPLQERFHEREQFNLLYLVSSAPPPYALDLVRWAKRCGALLVWNQNGVAFPAWAGKRVDFFNRPMAPLLHEADFVVYQSEFCRASADHFLGPVKAPSAILFNPVDLETFAPAAEPPPLDHWELLAAGTHHQPRRVIIPIEVLAQLRRAGHPARLTIAGELRWPNARAEVDEAIAHRGVADAVRFLPPFTRSEAPRLFRHAHVLLHLKYHDPCPTVVIESLASGVPVIGSRSGGMHELVGDEGGELLEVPLSWEEAAGPNAQAVAQAVERIFRDWPARSRAARARAERLFNQKTWVARHEEIFGHLLAP